MKEAFKAVLTLILFSVALMFTICSTYIFTFVFAMGMMWYGITTLLVGASFWVVLAYAITTVASSIALTYFMSVCKSLCIFVGLYLLAAEDAEKVKKVLKK